MDGGVVAHGFEVDGEVVRVHEEGGVEEEGEEAGGRDGALAEDSEGDQGGGAFVPEPDDEEDGSEEGADEEADDFC